MLQNLLRVLDILLAVVGLVVSSPMLILLIFAGWLDTGSPLYLHTRIGRNQQPFVMVKFRTMRQDTLTIDTHLVDPSVVTRMGRFMRRSKLDELPQLWNVIKGEMSLVGPRPCLPTQKDLIAERAKRGIFDVRPGVTGLAQLRGVDMSTPVLLSETEAQMLSNLSVASYLGYILLTIFGGGSGDRVRLD